MKNKGLVILNLWLSIVFMIVGKIIAKLAIIFDEMKYTKFNDVVIVVMLLIGMTMYIVGGVKILFIFKPILEVIK